MLGANAITSGENFYENMKTEQVCYCINNSIK